MIRNFFIFVLAVVLLTLATIEAATAAPASTKPIHGHRVEFCAKIGAGVSPDPDLPGNEWNIARLHTFGCDELNGAWVPPYVRNANFHCNVLAYEYARHGHSLIEVINYGHRHGCELAEDGTWLVAER